MATITSSPPTTREMVAAGMTNTEIASACSLDDSFQADPDAAARVLYAYTGDWSWSQINEKERDRYRHMAREIAGAHSDMTIEGYMPPLARLGLSFKTAGAAWPGTQMQVVRTGI